MEVTKEQKDKLDQYLGKLLPVAMQTLQKSKEWRPEEREAYDGRIHEEMAPTLKEILNERQSVRLNQLERQREGLFGSNFYWKDLKLTDAQRQQFVPIIQQADKKIQDLLLHRFIILPRPIKIGPRYSNVAKTSKKSWRLSSRMHRKSNGRK